MSNKTQINRFMKLLPFLKLESEATESLIELCGMLCSVRNFHALQSIAQQIHHPMGLYYQAVAENQWDNPVAFDVPYMPDHYKSRTLLGIAQSLRYCGDMKLAGKLFQESEQFSQMHNDYYTLYQSKLDLAILQSIDGDHESALAGIQGIAGLAKSLAAKSPALLPSYHNSLAVELAALGRIEEAAHASSIALASPFALAYPEWKETGIDIGRKGYRASRGLVAVSRRIEAGNVLRGNFPATETVPHRVPSGGDAGIVDIRDWKAEMANTKAIEEENKKNPPENIQKMGRQQKQKEIMNAILDQKTTDDELRDILKFITEKKSQRKDCQ